MQLNKNVVDTTVDVLDGNENTYVSIGLSDDVVISLYRKTMKGYCPVCSFNKLGKDRSICDACLVKEEKCIHSHLDTPYAEAVTRIMRSLMPDPPVESCISDSTAEAMTHLGVYTGCMSYCASPSRGGAITALTNLGCWVVARLSSMLKEQKC